VKVFLVIRAKKNSNFEASSLVISVLIRQIFWASSSAF